MTTAADRREYRRAYRARKRERIRAVQAAWRQRNHERRRVYSRAYWAAHLAERLCYRAKNSAERWGVAFDLTPADTAVPTRCPVLGLALRVGVGKFGPDSPTLVRLDLSQGFVRGNVRVISKQASWQRAPQQRTAAADGLRSAVRTPRRNDGDCVNER
jgi:hypothetical protein